MKTIVACLATALVVAAGAGAYNAAVTPRQFQALSQRVASQQATINQLTATVATIQQNVLQPTIQIGTGSDQRLGSVVSCLQQEWDAAMHWYINWDGYAINGAKYSSSGAAGLPGDETVLWIPLSQRKQC